MPENNIKASHLLPLTFKNIVRKEKIKVNNSVFAYSHKHQTNKYLKNNLYKPISQF